MINSHSYLRVSIIIVIGAFGLNLNGCLPQPFPKKYWADYLEKLEILSDSTKVVNDASYISSFAYYHPFFAIADSKSEASINYVGRLFLSDSVLCFVPEGKQAQHWPEIKPFRVRISTISKSTLGDKSQPISILLETSDITYLFFSQLSTEQLNRYKTIFN